MAKKKSSLSPMGKEAFSNIFKKAATREYPFVKATVALGFRGRQILDLSLCISCGLCSRDCPAKAIEMIELDGKKRPLFLLDKCIFCYQCAESCPKNAIQSSEFFELASTSKSSLVVKPTVDCKNGDELRLPKDH
jgi:formate hydrogenlyase subunit 6/NADH:ubiquinone oxidoreductase subunit I